MRVAIVHDDLTQRGGAERVVLSLARLFPEADVYTSVYDPDGTFEEFRSMDVRTTFLQRLPHAGGVARKLMPLYPLAFDRLVLRNYDLVLSSSSRFAHGVRAPGAFHLCYCHTPARWLYHQSGHYLDDATLVPRWAKPAARPVLGWVRRWDRRASERPDAYVCNSRVVAERIRSLYGREATVVHPPVDVSRVSPGGCEGDFYLVIARLLPYKRIDIAVRACTERGAKLVVVGKGPDRAELEARAGAGVEFRERVSDAELAALLRGCRALIQPGEEDFGIVPLEANAAGRPAVAYAGGGASETVVDGVTGVLFDVQDVASLHAALDRVEASRWGADTLREHALGFSEPRFHRELLAQIERLTGLVPA